MNIKDAIETILDSEEPVFTFQADAILRNLHFAMAYNTINDRHFIITHVLNGGSLIIKEADLIKAALEEVLLERYVVTTGVTRSGNGLNTGMNLEWRVIKRNNIFILHANERDQVKAWLSRMPAPPKVKTKQAGLWSES